MTGDGLDFVITRDDATSRIKRVRLLVESARDDIAALYNGRAWLTLGYESWDELCESEFAGVHIGLPRGDRREVVGNLREQGLSIPAIASALGVGVGTVHRDLDAAFPNGKPDAAITGQDGKTYPAHITTTSRTTESTKVEQDVDTDTGEILDGPTLAGRAAADRAPLLVIHKTAAEHERERIAQQNGWIARATKHLGGVQDPSIRARLVSEWDPALCDDNPSTVTPRNLREIANGLLAFADEMEATRGLRVV